MPKNKTKEKTLFFIEQREKDYFFYDEKKIKFSREKKKEKIFQNSCCMGWQCGLDWKWESTRKLPNQKTK